MNQKYEVRLKLRGFSAMQLVYTIGCARMINYQGITPFLFNIPRKPQFLIALFKMNDRLLRLSLIMSVTNLITNIQTQTNNDLNLFASEMRENFRA
jgi:hypothetical protein